MIRPCWRFYSRIAIETCWLGNGGLCMKRVATLIALLALATFAGPAFGAVVLDFGTGNAGVGGTFTLLAGGNATGVNIPIGNLTVSGAGGGKDGVYIVNALLSFDTRTATNFILINGSVGVCQTPG